MLAVTITDIEYELKKSKRYIEIDYYYHYYFELGGLLYYS